MDISAFLEVPKDTTEEDVREHLDQHGFYPKSKAVPTEAGTLVYVIEGPQAEYRSLEDATRDPYRLYSNTKMEPCGEQ